MHVLGVWFGEGVRQSQSTSLFTPDGEVEAWWGAGEDIIAKFTRDGSLLLEYGPHPDSLGLGGGLLGASLTSGTRPQNSHAHIPVWDHLSGNQQFDAFFGQCTPEVSGPLGK